MKQLLFLPLLLISLLTFGQRKFNIQVGSGTGVTAAQAGDLITQRVVSRSIESFGAVGDGTTNDTPAFLLFKAWALTQVGTVTLNLGSGKIYAYNDNTWVFGIPNLVVNGNGSELRNTATFEFDMAFSSTTGMGQRNAVGEVNTDVPFHLINNAAFGSDTIVLTTPAQHSNYSVGEWILIGAHDIYPVGFPRSFLKFDYAKITAKNTTTGKLTIDRPLTYSYKTNDIYNATLNTVGTGKASIYKIESGAAWGIKHVYNDIYFNTPARVDKTSDYVNCIGEDITLNRCTAWAINPTCAGTVRLNDCTDLGESEFDKLVNRVIVNGGVWTLLSSGVSIKSVEFNKSRIKGINGLSPHSLTFNDCVIEGLFNVGNRGKIDNLVINGGEVAQPTYEMYSLAPGQILKVTVGSDGVTYSSGVLSVPVSDPFMQGFLRNCIEGTVINRPALIDGSTYNPTSTQGKITSVTCDGTNALIAVRFNATISGGDVLSIFDEPKSVRITGAKMRNELTPFREYAVMGKKLILKDFTPANTYPGDAIVYYTPNFSGYPKRVFVDVKVPYSASGSLYGGNVVFGIKRHAPGYVDLYTIDLKTAGRREATRFGNSGFTGTAGESAGSNLSSTFLSTLHLYFPNFGSDTPGMLPVLDIEIEFD